MEGDQSLSQNDSQSSATEDHHRIKSESLPGDALFLTTQTLALAPRPSATAGATSSASPQPIIPSTETSNTNGHAEESPAPASMAGTTKKKGTAAPAKKVPKRARNGKTTSKKTAKKIKPEPTSSRATPAGSVVEEDEDEGSEGSEDDESDNGPYCICRGPDDHRWMICCEKCEDWFHGECIKLDKTIGESLIEKFICPNCTDETHTTLYQKTCALGGCRKPSRLLEKGGVAPLTNRSVFCSNEHAGAWWERIVARLPKGKMKAGLSDQLTQDEFMALLNHGLIGMNDEGAFRLADTPFKGGIPNDTPSGMLLDSVSLTSLDIWPF
jgi:COMPASS component SPP1